MRKIITFVVSMFFVFPVMFGAFGTASAQQQPRATATTSQAFMDNESPCEQNVSLAGRYNFINLSRSAGTTTDSNDNSNSSLSVSFGASMFSAEHSTPQNAFATTSRMSRNANCIQMLPLCEQIGMNVECLAAPGVLNDH